uniref:Uncharacterized protein n=1 Tax=Aegilops tauschii subsp. strangulata TaxID=200361 RepID=A0A453T077_AEGTS
VSGEGHRRRHRPDGGGLGAPGHLAGRPRRAGAPGAAAAAHVPGLLHHQLPGRRADRPHIRPDRRRHAGDAQLPRSADPAPGLLAVDHVCASGRRGDHPRHRGHAVRLGIRRAFGHRGHGLKSQGCHRDNTELFSGRPDQQGGGSVPRRGMLSDCSLPRLTCSLLQCCRQPGEAIKLQKLLCWEHCKGRSHPAPPPRIFQSRTEGPKDCEEAKPALPNNKTLEKAEAGTADFLIDLEDKRSIKVLGSNTLVGLAIVTFAGVCYSLFARRRSTWRPTTSGTRCATACRTWWSTRPTSTSASPPWLSAWRSTFGASTAPWPACRGRRCGRTSPTRRGGGWRCWRGWCPGWATRSRSWPGRRPGTRRRTPCRPCRW